MDTTTIVVIVAVAAILIFLWPRVGARRGGPTNLNPPASASGEGGDVFPRDQSSRTTVTPHAERPHGQEMPTNARAGDGDVVEEAIDDLRSQNPNKSL